MADLQMSHGGEATPERGIHHCGRLVGRSTGGPCASVHSAAAGRICARSASRSMLVQCSTILLSRTRMMSMNCHVEPLEPGGRTAGRLLNRPSFWQVMVDELWVEHLVGERE